MAEFEAITTQEDFNERIKARLAREREKWEKESGIEDLKAQLAAKDEEIAGVRREHFQRDARREIVGALASGGVTSEGRVGRILKHVDFDSLEPNEDGSPNRIAIDAQLQAIHNDLPELLPEDFRVGAGSGIGSKKPVLTHEPLTREELEGMSEEDINSRWDQVKGFLAGER